MSSKTAVELCQLAIARKLLTREQAKLAFNFATQQRTSLEAALVQLGFCTAERWQEFRAQFDARPLSDTGPRSPSGAVTLPTVGTIVNGYTLTKRLGQGGMGAVFKGEAGENQVVFKFLLNLDQRSKKRFMREAQAIQAVNDHPNVCGILGIGKFHETPYLALEWVDGQDLKSWLKERDNRVTESDLLDIARAVGSALAFIHDHGILHRDIKPANILITATNQIKLTDFGVAKITNAESLTRTSEVAGSAQYMAPEQIDREGAEIGPWTDIWGLGVTLLQLGSAGRMPFEAQSSIELAAQIMFQPPNLDHLDSSISEKLRHVLKHCLNKQPTERFQSANEFLSVLDCVESGDTLPRYITRSPRSSKMFWAIIMACVIILALIPIFMRFQETKRQRRLVSIKLREYVKQKPQIDLYLCGQIVKQKLAAFSQIVPSVEQSIKDNQLAQETLAGAIQQLDTVDSSVVASLVASNKTYSERIEALRSDAQTLAQLSTKPVNQTDISPWNWLNSKTQPPVKTLDQLLIDLQSPALQSRYASVNRFLRLAILAQFRPRSVLAMNDLNKQLPADFGLFIKKYALQIQLKTLITTKPNTFQAQFQFNSLLSDYSKQPEWSKTLADVISSNLNERFNAHNSKPSSALVSEEQLIQSIARSVKTYFGLRLKTGLQRLKLKPKLCEKLCRHFESRDDRLMAYRYSGFAQLNDSSVRLTRNLSLFSIHSGLNDLYDQNPDASKEIGITVLDLCREGGLFALQSSNIGFKIVIDRDAFGWPKTEQFYFRALWLSEIFRPLVRRHNNLSGKRRKIGTEVNNDIVFTMAKKVLDDPMSTRQMKAEARLVRATEATLFKNPEPYDLELLRKDLKIDSAEVVSKPHMFLVMNYDFHPDQRTFEQSLALLNRIKTVVGKLRDHDLVYELNSKRPRNEKLKFVDSDKYNPFIAGIFQRMIELLRQNGRHEQALKIASDNYTVMDSHAPAKFYLIFGKLLYKTGQTKRLERFIQKMGAGENNAALTPAIKASYQQTLRRLLKSSGKQ